MSKQFFKDKDTAADKRALHDEREAERKSEHTWLSSRDLHDGEVVEWEGRPATGIAFTGWDAWYIPFTLYMIYIMCSVFISVGTEGVVGLVLTPFFVIVVVTFYMAIGRFVVDMLHRRKLRYTITN